LFALLQKNKGKLEQSLEYLTIVVYLEIKWKSATGYCRIGAEGNKMEEKTIRF
jgi:hypothetical protein